jgi:tRNA-modifying protein YgfZ
MVTTIERVAKDAPKERDNVPSQMFTWKDAVILDVKGKHAERYLHNRLTQNIKSLAVGEHRPFAVTTPASKVQGVGTVIRCDKDHFCLVSKGNGSGDLLAAVAQYIVADQVTVIKTPQARLSYLTSPLKLKETELNFPLETLTSKNVIATQTKDTMLWSEQEGSYLLELQDNLLDLPQLTEEEMTVIRVKSHVPLFGLDFDESTLLMDTGLKETIAFGAGCYVGQEVIEKIDARGKAPHRLLYLTTPGEQIFTKGTSVEILNKNEWKERGSITSSSVTKLAQPAQSFHIAFIRNDDFEQLRIMGEYEAALI